MAICEKQRLESVAADSTYLIPSNLAMIEYCSKIFSRHIRGGRVLEMGPAEGVMTRHLVEIADELTVLEATETFCSMIQSKYPTVNVVRSLFEEFAPVDRFDAVVLGHVLEHVEDPVGILKLAQSWLAPEGRLVAAVPNARSLHRQAAVIMGLLPFEEAMNEADRHHGHRRVYNPESFRRDFLLAKLDIEVFGGYWLKPISNGQIERDWTPRMLDAFMRLGERYPDIAGEIYVVARQPDAPTTSDR
jgi:2-polyprenyl-3-methyl-5-hydroxy-6-metoxy-1,4-benzoquinol methylase